jgi:hypothetical protein
MESVARTTGIWIASVEGVKASVWEKTGEIAIGCDSKIGVPS